MFTAAFTSECEGCDEPIRPGDTAIALDYDRGLFAHARCRSDVSPRTVPTCPVCGLQHPGEC